MGGKAEADFASRLDLIDFYPYDTDLAPQVLALIQEYQDRIPERKLCGRKEFIALLAGIVALRKTPGIPGPDQNSFTMLPRCASAEDVVVCRAHLERVFGIADKESMPDFCGQSGMRGVVLGFPLRHKA